MDSTEALYVLIETLLILYLDLYDKMHSNNLHTKDPTPCLANCLADTRKA